MESRNKSTGYESNMLYGLRDSRSSFFSQAALDVTRQISLYYDFDINSEIGVALQHAAARQTNENELISMLKKKPHLLLQRGRVITPEGNDVRGVTLYEFLLGSGDPDFAKKIQPYFAEIKGIDGEAECLQQYERYRSDIENIKRQTPYDLKLLIDTLIEAPAEDVKAILENDMRHDSALRDIVAQFRRDFAPRIISEPCIHHNYASIIHALRLLDREWDNLTIWNNMDKLELLFIQIICFQMRRLSSIDRYMAKDGSETIACVRNHKYKRDMYEFPITINEDNFDQLTNDFRKFREQYAPHIRNDYLHQFIHRWIKFMIDFFESKDSKLMNLTGNVSPSKVTITYITRP